MVAKTKKQIKEEEKKKRADEEFKRLSGHLFERPVCANCGKKITKRRLKKAKKAKWLPLCEECDKFIKDQLEKCAPLMKNLLGGKKK